jgi:predicted lactoylglutathione lyase
MPENKAPLIFVNLAVKDLDRSKAFFDALGFSFNPQFTNEQGASMIVNDGAFVMLLREDFFKTFTKRQICESATHTETILALSCESREQVDEMVMKAAAAGGSHALDSSDQGFMYSWSFYDPDGHHWEVVWMDPAALQQS